MRPSSRDPAEECRSPDAGCIPGPERPADPDAGTDGERGERGGRFTFLALLLMVPLVYFIITVGQVQGGSFAVVGAADQAAKVFVAPPMRSGARPPPSRQFIALADFGHEPEQARVDTSCNSADCQAAGTAVTFTVQSDRSAAVHTLNNGLGSRPREVEASSTQMVGRFR